MQSLVSDFIYMVIFSTPNIIRKTKCSRAIKRSVSFYKTKRIPIHTIYKH